VKHKELVSWLNKWEGEGIISTEQKERMLSTFQTEDRGMLLRLLPLFVSILLGLSLLTFLASNWDGMSNEVKLVIIFMCVPTFYIAGALFYHKGKNSLGIGCLFLGVVSFGVAMLLISDMFQYMAYSASLFFFWSLFAFLFACLYRHMLLIGTAVLLSGIGQVYSVSAFQTVHVGILLASTLGIFYLMYKEERWGYDLLGALLIILQWCILLPVSMHNETNIAEQLVQCTIPFLMLVLLMMFSYVRKTDVCEKVVLISLYFYYVFNVLLPEVLTVEVKSFVIMIHIIAVGALLIYAHRKWRAFKIYEMLLFLPVLFITNETVAEWTILLIAVLYPIGMLLDGYAHAQQQKVAVGSRLFIVSMFAAYFQFGFSYMSKSAFFLIGAILLTGLYLFLSRKEKQILKEEKKR
jgi:uncharacterized membrane protein